jgi:diamine N-acetyltransferase
MKLTGEKIRLRPVEKDDATRLMLWENDPSHWKVSGTEVPFSMTAILDYISQAQNIRSHGQLRLMICLTENDEPVGALDLYNADFRNLHASVGILIAERSRNRGYASEALLLAEEYARVILGMKNLACSIHGDNVSSIALFEKAGYENVGRRKNWFLDRDKWLDEIIYQKWLEKAEKKEY